MSIMVSKIHPRVFRDADASALFKKLESFDSKIFVEIPQSQIAKPSDYRIWLVENVECKWMREFNQGNEGYNPYRPTHYFNCESGVCGFFNGVYLFSKFYRYDGTERSEFEDDYRSKRGFLIRDHYGEFDVVKVHFITDNLVDFLRQQGIEHTRTYFERSINLRSRK